jgi:hypothetical protein
MREGSLVRIRPRHDLLGLCDRLQLLSGCMCLVVSDIGIRRVLTLVVGRAAMFGIGTPFDCRCVLRVRRSCS